MNYSYVNANTFQLKKEKVKNEKGYYQRQSFHKVW